MFNIRDWNGNGVQDLGDAYIDYMIAHEVLNIPVDQNSTTSSPKDSNDRSDED